MPRHECPGGHFAGGTTMPTTPVSKMFGRDDSALGTTEVTKIDLGSFQYGQSKTVLLEVKNTDPSGIRVSVESFVKLSITDSISTNAVDQLTVDSYAIGILVEELKRIAKTKRIIRLDPPRRFLTSRRR